MATDNLYRSIHGKLRRIYVKRVHPAPVPPWRLGNFQCIVTCRRQKSRFPNTERAFRNGRRIPDHSFTLERRISERGISVEVLIYRGEDDAGWLLEVVDHAGGSTVWNEPFASDRAALDEALQTIAREGISSFAEDEPQTLH